MTDTPEDEGTERPPAWAARLAAQPGEVIPLLPAQHRPALPQPESPPPMSGLLNVYKPPGMTSHDVVNAVRKASGERRVGHAGTLDPLARGVLVLAMGSATRVIDEVQAGRKRYRARVKLGEATTTYDTEGEVVGGSDPSGVTHAQAEAALAQFRGEIDQTPPMFSAVKHEGQRLYRLARQGIEVPRAARRITVFELRLTDWDPPYLWLAMTVSSGTYVRSLAHDLGAALGVGAHLAELERTAVGPFVAEEAHPLVRVVEAFAEGWWPRLLHPLDIAVMDYAAFIVDEAGERAIRHGQQLAGPAPDGTVTAEVRAYNAEGRFIGLLRWDAVHGRWQPDRVFPAPPARRS